MTANRLSAETSPSGGRTRDARPDLVRTRTGTLVPRGSLEAGYKAAGQLEVVWRKRILMTLGALALLLGSFVLVAMTRGGGRSSKIEGVLRDAGYVISVRKGIGINR